MLLNGMCCSCSTQSILSSIQNGLLKINGQRGQFIPFSILRFYSHPLRKWMCIVYTCAWLINDEYTAETVYWGKKAPKTDGESQWEYIIK